MAGWDRNANWNREALERIAALLFALANLAELAAGLPFLRRRQVLCILSCGEAEARAFVIGVAIGAPAPSDTQGEVGDAARLAASFRALALLLCALLAQAALFAPRAAFRPQVSRERSVERASRHAALPAPDTS